MNTDNQKSARPCGCDEAAGWQCQWHTELSLAMQESWLRKAEQAEMKLLADSVMRKEEELIMEDHGRQLEIGRPFDGVSIRPETPADRQRREEAALQKLQHFAAQAGKTPVGNGVQTDFGTGATRSSDTGKIDYEGHISPRVIRIFGEYMNDHRVQRDGKLRGSDNWQNGIPVFRYTKSLIRHVQEFHCMWRGEEVVNIDSGKPFTFRTVLCAILFNVMGLLYELSRGDGAALHKTHVTTEKRKTLETL